LINKLEVIGLGAMNLDQLYLVDRTLAEGETQVESFQQTPGGSAANTIYGLARLGVSTGFVGTVGNDSAGQLLIEDLSLAGVDTSRIRVKEGRTGTVLGFSDRSGKRALYVSPGANDLLDWQDIDLDYVNQAGLIHITSLAGEQQCKLSLELVERLSPGVRVSFAPGMLYARKGPASLRPILARTALLFVNRQELELLAGKGLLQGVDKLHDMGCRLVAVTLGKGIKMAEIQREKEYKRLTAACYVSDGKKGYAIEATRFPDLPLTDATGAGDAFAAGFLYGLLHDKGPQDCGRLGHLLALFAMSQAGARHALPTIDELRHKFSEVHPSPL
jgi:ribokinase